MREVINHLTHIHLLNTIKSIITQTLEKLCKTKVHGMEDLDNLYFWNTLNKTHHNILVWNRNRRLHTINKKHVRKERKEITHVKIGEITYINIYKPNISTMYVKWPQDQYTKDNVSKIERKEKIQESSLHPSYKHSPYLLY